MIKLVTGNLLKAEALVIRNKKGSLEIGCRRV
jgi:hypothetical protein